jgi:hypothetical protein
MIIFLNILAVHWVADFLLQTHWVASNKSKNAVVLALHVGLYSIVLGCACGLLLGAWGLTYAGINGFLHWGTDYFTSRWSARLWAKQDWHNFFVVIGLDQLIHQMTLGGTMLLIFGGG